MDVTIIQQSLEGITQCQFIRHRPYWRKEEQSSHQEKALVSHYFFSYCLKRDVPESIGQNMGLRFSREMVQRGVFLLMGTKPFNMLNGCQPLASMGKYGTEAIKGKNL